MRKNFLGSPLSVMCGFLLACVGSGCGSGSEPLAIKTPWHPIPGMSWQIQYTGTIDTSLDVQVYDLDLFGTSKATIDQLHSQGRRVICYFNAGAHEEWRPDASSFPASVLGLPLVGWPGERWLDVRQIDVLRPIMAARLDMAQQKGCDAVDPDNVDGYTNPTGFMGLSAADQLVYNRMIADEAHQRGLAVGLKNGLDQIPDLLPKFDFAVNESCVEERECDGLRPFIAAGKPVFGIEYTGTAATVCPTANQLGFDTLIKNLGLDASRIACR